ncbi:MAG: hypothetical protein Aurels2KO_37220 [Aureliella sp.]
MAMQPVLFTAWLNRNPYWCNTMIIRFSLMLAVTFAASGYASAADHLDSPSVQVDHSVDINDLYAFQSPRNSNNVVFIMTVNPLAGVLSGTTFNPRAVYEFGVDLDADAKPDYAYRFYFSSPRRGVQRFVVVDISGRPGGVGRTGSASRLRGGGQVTAGVFDDPFFFDLAGFNNGLQFTGVDFFAGANVSAIVLEIPRANIPTNNISVSARTVVRGRQFDRMGRPAINTVLIPAGKKDSFNKSLPQNDVTSFTADVKASLVGLGNSAERATALAGVLLPDVLTFNTSDPSGFLNGRRLGDDVIDAELSLITEGALPGDGVNANDLPFRSSFPYLAPAH